jgi:transcription initiation factor IIE alpha subunit
MDERTLDRIAALSGNVKIFYQEILPLLSEDHKEVIFSLIGNKSMLSAIKIIECIDGEEKTYKEISSEVNLHFNTVKQICYALSEDFNITCDKYVATANTGAPRKIIKI